MAMRAIAIIHPAFPHIHVAGVQKVVLNLLIGPQQLHEANIDTHLVQAMTAYPEVNSLMFGSKLARQPSNVTVY